MFLSNSSVRELKGVKIEWFGAKFTVFTRKKKQMVFRRTLRVMRLGKKKITTRLISCFHLSSCSLIISAPDI